MSTAIHPPTERDEPRLVRPLGSKAELVRELMNCHDIAASEVLALRVRATHLALFADAGDARPDMNPHAMGVEQR